MKKSSILLIFAILLSFFFSCNKPEKPVAKIGGNWISFEQWQAFLDNLNFKDYGDQEKLNKMFDNFIKREVTFEVARRRGLLSGKQWNDQIEKITQNAVIYNFIVTKYLNGVSETSEEEIYEVYKIDNSRRHLWGVTVKGKEQAQNVSKSLRKGESIEKIFETHKNDLPDGPKSYDLGYPKYAELPPEVQKVFINGAEGDVLDPIQLEQDIYMVVILKELQITPKPNSFDQNTIKKAKGVKLTKAMLKANEEYKNEFPETYDKELVSELLKNEGPSKEDLNKTIGKIGSKEIKFSILLERYFRDVQKGANLPENEETLKKVFEKIVMETRVYLAGKKLGIDKDKNVLAEIWNETHELGASICFSNYLSEVVIKEEELKEFYQKNITAFSDQSSFNLRYLLSLSPQALNNAVVMFKNGAKWEEILKVPGILPDTGSGIMGWKTENDLNSMFNKNIVEKLKSMERGKWLAERIGPDRIIGIFVEDIKRGASLSFEQAREKVRELYVKEKGIKLFEDFINNDARKNVKVETYPQNIK